MRKAIALALLVAPALADDAQTALDALRNEYRAAMNEFYRPAQEAQAKGEKFKLDRSKDPSPAYAAKFAAFAKEHPKTEVAAKALVMALRASWDPAFQREVAAVLLRDHADWSALKDAINYFEPDALATIAETSPHADVRGIAMLRLAERRMQGEPDAARAILLKVKEKYGDVPYMDGTLGQKADGDVYEIDWLGIGKVAPEIEGEDVDGKPIELSDFKGKVVVLDFWGDW